MQEVFLSIGISVGAPRITAGPAAAGLSSHHTSLSPAHQPRIMHLILQKQDYLDINFAISMPVLFM